MTDRQLQVLHQRGEAKLGQIYISDTGKRYVGIELGRLRLVQSTDVSSLIDALQTQIDDLQAQIDAIPGSVGGEDLDATLTIGNDGGAQDIVNLAGLQDSTANRSIDVENRQLVDSTGGVWTLDWQALQLSDLAGQLGIDWGTRELVDNTLVTTFDWQNLAFPTLSGVGTRMVTVDASGNISDGAIPTGTVTNIATTAPISGGPITTTGTITTSMATNRLIGRGTAGTGVMEEITLGSGLELSSTTLKPDFVVLGKSGATVNSTNTVAEEILASVLIPSGTLGNNDEIRASALFDATGGAAGNRIFRIRLHTSAAIGGTVYQQATLGTGGGGYAALAKIYMKNASNLQEGFGQLASVWGTGSNVISSALSTGSDMYIIFSSLKVTAGTDGATLRAYSVEQIRA